MDDLVGSFGTMDDLVADLSGFISNSIVGDLVVLVMAGGLLLMLVRSLSWFVGEIRKGRAVRSGRGRVRRWPDMYDSGGYDG